MRVDVYHHSDETHDALRRIEGLLRQVLAKEDHMSKELDALTLQVQANADAEASAILLIQGLAAQIAAAANDPAAITALATTLKTSADALGAAIVANTPATPPATP